MHKSVKPKLKSVKESEYSQLSYTSEYDVHIESNTSIHEYFILSKAVHLDYIVTNGLVRQRKEEETIQI